MKTTTSLLAALLVVCLCFNVFAQEISQDVADLMATIKGEVVDFGIKMLEKPRFSYKNDGYVNFAAAPPGTFFETVGTDPQDIALNFIAAHSDVVGIKTPHSSFAVKSVTRNKHMTYVRLKQTYRDIPVFGGEITVKVFKSDGVGSVCSNIMRSTEQFDTSEVSVTPTLTPAEAKTRAATGLKEKLLTEDEIDKEWLEKEPLIMDSEPELIIFDDSIFMDSSEPPRLVWTVKVTDVLAGRIHEKVFLDAHTGDIVLRQSLICRARVRNVYDLDGEEDYREIGVQVCDEGSGCDCGAPQDACDLYVRLAEVYEFYNDMHGRDSYNDSGGTLTASVLWGEENAGWYDDEKRMLFGEGWVADDVVGHEFTHGVIHDEEGPEVIARECGAIAESLCDIWGEFIDLTYGYDDPEDIWYHAEDVDAIEFHRCMHHPSSCLHLHPEYYEGPGWMAEPEDPEPPGIYPYWNMGVGNKLCHLLTAGDEDFRELTFNPLDDDLETAIAAVSKLYYHLLTGPLQTASDFEDLGNAMYDAVVDAALELIDLGDDIDWNAGAIQKVVYAIIEGVSIVEE